MTTISTLSFDEQKNIVGEIIVKSFKESGMYVDFGVLLKQLDIHFFDLTKILKGLFIEDSQSNMPTRDSLVTSEGKLMPEATHFEIRESSRVIGNGVTWEVYHNNMMKRWCKLLEVDFEKVKCDTKTNMRLEIAMKRDENRKCKQRDRQPTDRARQIGIAALQSQRGTFSMREILRRAS